MQKRVRYLSLFILCNGALPLPLPVLAEPVDLAFIAPEAKEVYVAGSFDAYWQKRHPMYKDASGRWRVSIDLPPGRYELQYVVDSRWMYDPSQPSVEDGFGERNNILIVAPEN